MLDNCPFARDTLYTKVTQDHKKAIDRDTQGVGLMILADVNSRSRSLYAVARPSVVFLSSVTLVRFTQSVEIFGNFSAAFGTLTIP